MLSIIIGLVFIGIGVGMIWFFVRRFKDPEAAKSYQRASELAEEYTIPMRCRIENCVYGFNPYTEISVLAESGHRVYRVPVSSKESDLGMVRIFYRHKEEPTAFVPDYMIFDSDVKYLKRKSVIGVLIGALVICAGFVVMVLL